MSLLTSFGRAITYRVGFCLLLLLGASAADLIAGDQAAAPVAMPLSLEETLQRPDAYRVQLSPQSYANLQAGPNSRSLRFPISENETLLLELERFQVTNAETSAPSHAPFAIV